MATTEPQKWSATLGANADVNSLPATTPAGSGRASTSGLFPQVTQKPLDEGGIAPERGDFNALFKYLGEYLFYLMQGGMFSYSASYPYSVGDLVRYNGNLYRCIQAHAAGAAAPSNASFWAAIASAGDIPTKTSQLQNDSGFVTSASVPTKTSQLQNDSGFITSASVPTVNNGTLTIQQDGVTVGTFTANQSGNSTVNITGGGGGGEGTFSGTILGGFVGSSSHTPGTYKGIVGTEYDIEVLFQQMDGTGHYAFAAYPLGTKFECVVASSAHKETGGDNVYQQVVNGAFKLKSLGTGGA